MILLNYIVNITAQYICPSSAWVKSNNWLGKSHNWCPRYGLFDYTSL